MSTMDSSRSNIQILNSVIDSVKPQKGGKFRSEGKLYMGMWVCGYVSVWVYGGGVLRKMTR